jgi:hypothetical protein
MSVLSELKSRRVKEDCVRQDCDKTRHTGMGLLHD